MLLLMLALPALAHARISINIDVASQEEDVKIDLKGKEQVIATLNDLRAFGLSLSEFKEWAMGEIRKKSADDIGIPVRESDGRIPSLERVQIKKTIEPVSAAVLALDSKPSVLAHHTLKNNGPTTSEYAVNLERDVITTVTHSSEDTKKFNAYAELSASLQGPVGVAIGNIAASASVSYDHQWGTSTTESKKTTVRSNAGLKAHIEPYHTMEATMMASHGSMDIEVIYDIHLTGSYILGNKLVFPARPSAPSFLYYEYSFKEFCDWAGIPDRVQVTEIMTIEFYTDVDTELVSTPMDISHVDSMSENTDVVEEAN